MDDTQLLLHNIIEGIQERKGKKIVTIDLSAIDGPVSSYFVVCQGDSTTHVSSIADSIKEFVNKQIQVKPYAVDGYENSEWIVFDYGHILVHVFLREARDFYRLENLWSDAKLTNIPDIL
jgi:ribosome-associated protein